MRSYLIVDDNRAFAENLGEILADTGAHVDLADCGGEALERARATRYDALITDMKMPGMNGAELVHQLHALDPGLPAVVITAYTNDEDLAAARREGLLAVLPKPAPVGRLLEIMAGARRDGLAVIVEDDVALADNLSELLRSRGFAAVTAGSILETDLLGPVHPFIGLVDLRMPGGPDGAALARLRAKFPALPLLIVTAHADVAPTTPHVAVFTKPFDSAALLAAVEQVFAARPR